MSNKETGSKPEPTTAVRAWSDTTGGTSGSSKAPRKNKKKSSRHMPADVRRYGGTLFVLAVILVVCVIGFMPLNEKITQGLDLRGGVSVIMTAEKPDGSQVTDADMESAVNVVTNRVNSLGASEATVQRQGSDQILVQIPGATDAQQAIDTIGTTGVLEFVDLNDIADQDALLKLNRRVDSVVLEPGTYTAFMTGDDVRNVTIGMENQGSAYYAVNLTLSSEGAKRFAEVTEVLAPTHGAIAIVLDGVVQSAPSVQSRIPDGHVSITGGYTLEQAQSFKTVLESGSLPVTLEFSDSRAVGPTLGQDSLQQALLAVSIGFVVILVYLFFFYQGLGLVTAGALLVFGIVYLGLLAFLSSLGQFALSLPGLAGIVLTIGMAADASILVLERFREELRQGRSIRKAAVSGSKHGIGTAIDAGVVSLISALGLFFLTTGSVRGFGLTLALGVLCSFFTLLTFTTPLLRLLGRSAIERHPRFWGVQNDIEEGLEAGANKNHAGSSHVKAADAGADANSLKGGDLDA